MMKKYIGIILIIIIMLTGCASNEEPLSYVYQSDSNNIPVSTVLMAEEADFYAKDLVVVPTQRNDEDPNITATSSLLINITDDLVIHADKIYQRMYPASITKIITALVVLENANLDDTVTISYNASHIMEAGAKLCGFQEGDKINLGDLLNIFLVYSGNDAGVALAEHIAGTEEAFAKMMNETAKRIGAVHSNFVNAHGLHHDEHYTTAYDLYLIFNELLKYQEFVSIIDSSSFIGTYMKADGEEKTHQFMNTNRYLLGKANPPEGIHVIGGKTGTTSKAGSCLILYSKDNNNKEYISLILQANGGNNLYTEMTYLLDMIE